MAHYAILNMSNVVTKVITGKDEGDTDTNWELFYQDMFKQVCKRTSYNTKSGKHLLGGTPFRKNYAAVGYTYDQQRDAFIPPKPYDSWVLNEDTCNWEAPIQRPENDKINLWNENDKTWTEIDN
tara:strand:+ start:3124 stop:3495 length:372 start_codon:yes stop_codon:yes gene_type:complete